MRVLLPAPTLLQAQHLFISGNGADIVAVGGVSPGHCTVSVMSVCDASVMPVSQSQTQCVLDTPRRLCCSAEMARLAMSCILDRLFVLTPNLC